MVTIYTMEHCPYCKQAKVLLKERGVPFTEHKMEDEAQWSALFAKSPLRTVPQIFSGTELIGGYTDLAKIDATTKLVHLKQQ